MRYGWSGRALDALEGRYISGWNWCGPTAARKQGQPGREHSHVRVPPSAAELVRPYPAAAANPLAAFADAAARALNEKQEADIAARGRGFGDPVSGAP